jgi:hypothetical protein
MAAKETVAPKIEPAPSNAPSNAKPNKVRNALLTTIAFDLTGPIAGFYLLLAFGFSVLTASLLIMVLPIGNAVVQFVRRRQLDQLACVTVVVLALLVVLALVSASPRLILAKDGIITGVVGLCALGTLLGRRPLYFAAARPFGEEADENWDERWVNESGFRHLMRTVTSVWGIGLTLDALVKVLFAYTLPINAVPGIAGIQYAVVFVGLVLFTVRYVRRHDQRPARIAAEARSAEARSADSVR